jgi:predicted amidohydrolase
VRLACLQLEPIFGHRDDNLARIRGALTGRRADLVVLPELVTTGYVFADRGELASLAEEVPGGPSTEVLASLSARTGQAICAGIAERDGDRLYNAAVLVGPEGYIGTYRKVHLFDRENALFDTDDTGFRVFDVGGVRVGVMICFDWFYPESTRTLALSGADVVAHPSNLVLSWCQRSMPVRCLENHIACATANRTGTESRGGVSLTFTGESQITGFAGDVLARAPLEGEAWIEAEIEPERARDRALGSIRDTLAHRRPHLYATGSRS